MTTTKGAPNETSEDIKRREDAERVARELIVDTKAKAKDEEVIAARVDESVKDREARQAQHTSDERALADVGRVREISDSLDRDQDAYNKKLDNAIRRLKGLAGNPSKAVHDAVMAVAKRHNIEVTAEGLVQPKNTLKKGDANYPFAD